MADAFFVTVVYLAPGVERIARVQARLGDTLAQAIRASGVEADLPGGALTPYRVGVWGKLKASSDPVCAGDRVEIYRPLVVDPKVARQRRVVRKRTAGKN